MQIRKRLKISRPESEFDKALEQELLSSQFELSQVINNGLKFSDNFNANMLEVADTGNADTEFSITHTLGRTPVGYIIYYASKAAVLYNGASAWTTTKIYLKCNSANANIKVLVF